MTDWQRLSTELKERMDDLAMDIADVAWASGVHARTVSGIVAGTPRGEPRSANLGRISRAVGWTAGSAQTTLDGGEPVVINQPDVAALRRERQQARVSAQVAADLRELSARVSELGDEVERLKRGDGRDAV